MKKITSLITLSQILNKKRANKKIVFISGVFDLFHFGHFEALKRGSTYGDILVVQIDGNNLVRIRKGFGRPNMDQKYRALIISSLEFVDYVFISNSPSESKKTLTLIKPDVFLREVHPNQSKKERLSRELKILNKMPLGRIIWFEKPIELSTTKIINILDENLNNSFLKEPLFRKNILAYWRFNKIHD